jgi:hypothetical protein
MPASTERRFRRFSVNVPCYVKPSKTRHGSKATVIPAETTDISRGGLCLVANADWKIGTEFECVLHLPVEPSPKKPIEIQCYGRIVRVVHRAQGGIEVGATIDRFSYPSPVDALSSG